MMIPSNYAINIARDTGKVSMGKVQYSHFAAVELGSVSSQVAIDRYNEFTSRFPAPEFSVSMSHVECYGREVATNY